MTLVKNSGRSHDTRAGKCQRYGGATVIGRRLAGPPASVGPSTGQQLLHGVAAVPHLRRERLLLRLHGPVHLSRLLRARPMGLGEKVRTVQFYTLLAYVLYVYV